MVDVRLINFLPSQPAVQGVQQSQVSQGGGSNATGIASIPVGTTLSGFIINRDANGNPILRTESGDIAFESNFFLKIGSEVDIRIQTSGGHTLARILSVNGQPPEIAEGQSAFSQDPDVLLTPTFRGDAGAGARAVPTQPVSAAAAPLVAAPAAQVNTSNNVSLTATLLTPPTDNVASPQQGAAAQTQPQAGTRLTLKVINLQLDHATHAATQPAAQTAARATSSAPALSADGAPTVAPSHYAAYAKASGSTPFFQAPAQPYTPPGIAPQAQPAPAQTQPHSVFQATEEGELPITPPVLRIPAGQTAVEPVNATQALPSQPNAAPLPNSAPAPAAPNPASPQAVFAAAVTENEIAAAPLQTQAQPAPAQNSAAPAPTQSGQLQPLQPSATLPQAQPLPGQPAPAAPTSPAPPITIETSNPAAPNSASPATPQTAAAQAAAPAQPAANVVQPHVPPQQGQVIQAVVIGHEPTGEALVQTPSGVLRLNTTTTLPIGTKLTVEITQIAAQPAATSSTAPTTRLLELSQQWTSLQQIFTLLGERPGFGGLAFAPQGLPQISEVPQTLPNGAPQPSFSAGLMLFMTALRGGDFRNWLGRDNVQWLEDNGHKGLVDKASGEFSVMARQFTNPPPNQWQTLFFPIAVEGELQQVRMFTKRERKQQGEGRNAKPEEDTRFIVEMELSQLGAMQMDGFIRQQPEKLQFDLMVRTTKPLADEVQQDIQAIYQSTAELTGYVGTLQFQSAKAFPVRPMEDLMAQNRGNVVA